MNAAPDNVVAFPVVDAAIADPDAPAHVQPGDYAVTYVNHAGVSVFGKPREPVLKVRVDFRLICHPDLTLHRWYRVQGHAHGRIRAGRHSDIVREISAVLGVRVRPDRIPVSLLQGSIVNARVRDVVTDRLQRRVDSINVYSVIDRLLGREQ